MIDFTSIAYLASGNQRQQLACQELKRLQVIEKLTTYQPILVGTIPIDIDIPESDLDIICECKDLNRFQNKLIKLFSEKKAFKTKQTQINTIPSVVCTFKTPHFEIEIFGQDIPVKKQNAYRHMLIEHRLLTEKGTDFKKAIIQLKKEGYKTEPAFAKLLRLSGNPYDALLELE